MAELNAIPHCIQIFTNTCEVTMQVKRNIFVGKTILHKSQYVLVLCCNGLHIIWHDLLIVVQM